MELAVFSALPHVVEYFEAANAAAGGRHCLRFLEPRLARETAVLARGFPAVCAFVNDNLRRPVLEELARLGVRLIALRCAGFNHVDLLAARDLKLAVVNVPAYSPFAVAEHTVALMLALNRKLYRAYNRVREGNFSLEGLMGFDLHNCTAGVIGAGRIGLEVVRILRGFGCAVLAHDARRNPEALALGATFLPLEELFPRCEILTLHCPLTRSTRHLINAQTLARMKPGVMLINTSRGGLIDTVAVIEALKSGHLGYLGLDVYEEEDALFFEDLSDTVIQDDVFARLLTFPNVLITGHQAFFTRDAVRKIAETTLANVSAFEAGGALQNVVGPPPGESLTLFVQRTANP